MDETYTLNYWDHPNYGGPVMNPILRDQKSGELKIPNSLNDKLNEVMNSAQEFSGLFKIVNIKVNDQEFIDLDIFVHDAGSEENLERLNNAQNYKGDKKLSDLADLLTGHARALIF